MTPSRVCDAMFNGNVKVLVAISGTVLSNAPDTVYSAHAMERCKLTAHLSTKLNRSHLITGELSDVAIIANLASATLRISNHHELALRRITI